ncbi:DUF2490 domain-containing protein [Carboxylicivirga caseinilyticus]|uniref:DUF2490 domain-containing protein n=1 Tax=Carboxylicivirga caseinilyticus TaxID=3417572 RepID=UPI003D358B8A|nr:DUF2490 domain-containing protein [Marinilabiliaceae bacterium A049]
MKQRFYIIVLLLLSVKTIDAQVEDFVTWWNFTVKGEISKKLNYSFEPELRFFENSSQLSSWQSEFSLDYEVIKNLNIGGLYRYTVDYRTPDFNRRRNRFSLFFKYEVKTGHFRWQYRGIWQNDFTNVNTSVDGKTDFMAHRHKFAVKFKDKDWPVDPSFGVEYISALAPSKDLGEWKRRWFINVEREINKRLSAKISYKRQNEFEVSNPDLTNILLVGLEYEPKFLKRKKKKNKNKNEAATE